jgi:hypothetical protein
VFVTVWSPTLIALALSLSFEGISGVRNLLGFLFRGFSKNNWWYLIGVLVPVAAIATAIIIARRLHSGAPFLPLAALPLTLAYKSLLAQWARNWDGEGSFFLTLNASLAPGSRR